MSNLFATEERREAMDFSDPYKTVRTVMVVANAEAPAEEGFLDGIRSSFEKTFIRENRWQMILSGLLVTLEISLLSGILGTALGFGLCLLLRSRRRAVSGAARVFCRIMEGVPNLVVEADANGLHIYRNTVGVMTNSPSYDWHRTNLLNYAAIRDLDYDTVEMGGERLEQCFSGSGAQGLPGDWSAPSRFVRLAYLRKFAVRGKDEKQGIARLLRIMGSAAFPLGMVRVSQPGEATELDRNIQPWDYTIYTVAACAQTGRFCWTTYDNPAIRSVTLSELEAFDQPMQLPIWEETEFLPVLAQQ